MVFIASEVFGKNKIYAIKQQRKGWFCSLMGTN